MSSSRIMNSLLLLLLGFAIPAHAHEVRPAYFEVIEQQDGIYSLTWKQPSLAEARIHPGIFARRGGILDLSTLTGPGFGYRVEEIGRELP